jgi:hypothetical protein
MYVTVYKEMGHSRKDPHSPHEEISAVQKGRVEQFVSDNSVLGHPKGVGGLTSYFLHGGRYGCFLE